MKTTAPYNLRNLVRLILLAGFMCWSAYVSPSAKADIIGFEAMSNRTQVQPGSAFIESGFTITVAEAPMYFAIDLGNPGMGISGLQQDSSPVLRFTRPNSTFEFISYDNFLPPNITLPNHTVRGYLNDVLIAEDVYMPQTTYQSAFANNLAGVTIDRLDIIAPVERNLSPFDNVRFGNVSAVPEPGSFVCFGLAGCLAGTRRFRKRRASA